MSLSSSAPISTNLLKQLVQGSIFLAFSIWCVKLNVYQREAIIADSLLSRMLYFPMNSIDSLLVGKKGILLSRLMQMSIAYWFFVCGKCTVWPSSKSRKSLQAIISVLHLESFRYATLHSARSTQTYRPVAGLTNALNMSSTGFSRSDFHSLWDQLLEYLYFFVCFLRRNFLVHKQIRKRLFCCFVILLFQPFSLTVGCTLHSSMITGDRDSGTMLACYSFWSSLHLPCCCY